MSRTKRRVLNPEDIPEVKEIAGLETLIPETEQVGKVIYESDIRATSHSNGRVADLLDDEVGSGDPPKNPDDSDGRGDHRGDNSNIPDALRYVLAGVYFGVGCIAFYVSLTMIKELRSKKND